MNSSEQKELIAACGRECLGAKSYILPIHFKLTEVLTVIGNLQLALRHPSVRGTQAAGITQMIIDRVIERVRKDGYVAVAQMMDLGNNLDDDRL